MYISQKLSNMPSKDLQLYSTTEIESVFIERLIPNKQNYSIGTVYKHPSMKHFKFKDDYITHKYTQVKDVHQSLETLLSNNFIPQITFLSRVAEKSETVIGDIYSGNHDHDQLYFRQYYYISI